MSNILPYTMQKNVSFTAEDAKLLWTYWQDNYSGRKFSVSQIATIWYGQQQEEAVLQEMQNILAQSPYFSPNMRQLFLFEANTQEEIEKALAPKEQTIQDVEIQIQEVFAGFGYRKIGYYPEKREAVLQFDYPDSIDRVLFQQGAAAFQEKTGWMVSVNPSMNHTAAGSLLYAAFGGRIQKVSYYVDKKQYSVTVSGAADGDREAAETFYRQTGWNLYINGKCFRKETTKSLVANEGTSQKISHMEFVPKNTSMRPIEQNFAFSCIDQSFAGIPDQIEKKSIRQDVKGKYLELSFVSPMVGERYREELQQIADQIGWRIQIADKVNQNALFQMIRMLCAEQGIALAKNPSYIPDRRVVVVKTAEAAGYRRNRRQSQRHFRNKRGVGVSLGDIVKRKRVSILCMVSIFILLCTACADNISYSESEERNYTGKYSAKSADGRRAERRHCIGRAKRRRCIGRAERRRCINRAYCA